MRLRPRQCLFEPVVSAEQLVANSNQNSIMWLAAHAPRTSWRVT
jgi:hypothetical protein